jgi:hypothetical protein
MAAQNYYVHDIRSIRDVHPNLPAVLGNLDLNLRIQADTPIDRVLLTQAQGVAKALKGIKGIRCHVFLCFSCSLAYRDWK